MQRSPLSSRPARLVLVGRSPQKMMRPPHGQAAVNTKIPCSLARTTCARSPFQVTGGCYVLFGYPLGRPMCVSAVMCRHDHVRSSWLQPARFLGHLGFHCKIRLSALSTRLFSFRRPLVHASSTLSFATNCKEPPPRKPCHHGAFVISLVPRRRRRFWMDGIWRRRLGLRAERLRRWERFIHGPPAPSATFIFL